MFVKCCRYDIDANLNEEDKAVVVAALYFHPRKSEKIGTGIMDIKVKGVYIYMQKVAYLSFTMSLLYCVVMYVCFTPYLAYISDVISPGWMSCQA